MNRAVGLVDPVADARLARARQCLARLFVPFVAHDQVQASAAPEASARDLRQGADSIAEAALQAID